MISSRKQALIWGILSSNRRRSIPVIHQKRQLNKKEPQGMIELHLGGCKQNNQALEVPNELYTE